MTAGEMRELHKNLRILKRKVFQALANPATQPREPVTTESAIAVVNQNLNSDGIRDWGFGIRRFQDLGFQILDFRF